jgi:hypothetical protein
MDIQEELFYAVINCNHTKIYKLIQQGANIHFFFTATKFLEFNNVHVLTSSSPYTYLLIVYAYLCHIPHTSKPLQFQYGLKTKMSDWIMFDKSKLVKGLTAANYEDTFIFLLDCGASLHQIVPFNYDHESKKTSTFDYIIDSFLWTPNVSFNLLLKIIAKVKINFNAPSLKTFCSWIFNGMKFENNYTYKGHYFKEILKVALLNGLTLPEISRRQRKKWARDARCLLEWNTFMLIYCCFRKNVNTIMFPMTNKLF